MPCKCVIKGKKIINLTILNERWFIGTIIGIRLSEFPPQGTWWLIMHTDKLCREVAQGKKNISFFSWRDDCDNGRRVLSTVFSHLGMSYCPQHNDQRWASRKMIELTDLNLKYVKVRREKRDHVQFKFFKDGFPRHLKVVSATDSDDDDIAKTLHNKYTFTIQVSVPSLFVSISIHHEM